MKTTNQEMIECEEELKGFEIGHENESMTLFLNAIELDKDLYLVDTPGFFDSRGSEIEIATAVCFTRFLQNCKTAVPILLINFSNLIGNRGESLKNLIKLVSNILADCDK